MKKRILPPTIFFILLATAVGLHLFFPITQLIPFPYNTVGVLPIMFGIVMNLWADALFKKKQTTVKPHEVPDSFLDGGPFAISRNPMYLGMSCILFGTAICLGSLTPFLSPFIFMIHVGRTFIPVEEHHLEKKFGAAFVEYKKKVRRWV